MQFIMGPDDKLIQLAMLAVIGTRDVVTVDGEKMTGASPIIRLQVDRCITQIIPIFTGPPQWLHYLSRERPSVSHVYKPSSAHVMAYAMTATGKVVPLTAGEPDGVFDDYLIEMKRYEDGKAFSEFVVPGMVGGVFATYDAAVKWYLHGEDAGNFTERGSTEPEGKAPLI